MVPRRRHIQIWGPEKRPHSRGPALQFQKLQRHDNLSTSVQHSCPKCMWKVTRKSYIITLFIHYFSSLNDTQSTGTISTLFLTYNFGIQGALTAKIAQNWHGWRCHQHGVHEKDGSACLGICRKFYLQSLSSSAVITTDKEINWHCRVCNKYTEFH